MLLVQFVSDLSVTSDGFLARYTSISPGSQVSTDEAEAGTRSIPSKPAVKPIAPERPATTAQPPAPTVKYVPTERPKPVKPTRGRGQGTTGQDRRVAVTRPNGKRPGGWSYVHAMLVYQCAQDLLYISNMHFYALFTSLVPQNPLCARACQRQGTIKTSFCASEFGKSPVARMCNK